MFGAFHQDRPLMLFLSTIPTPKSLQFRLPIAFFHTLWQPQYKLINLHCNILFYTLPSAYFFILFLNRNIQHLHISPILPS